MPKETIRKLNEDVGRLLVAGAHLAAADAALAADKAKLESLAKQLGDKAPVLGQLAAATGRAVAASGAEAAREVCTLAAHAAQVRAAQVGLAPAEGATTAVEASAPIGTPCNARYVYDIHEALTRTGSGRDEPITNGVQTGQIVDLRLRDAAIRAVADTYIGHRVAKEVLPLFGSAVSPDLRAAFSAKGGAADGRRLAAITAIEKAGAKDLIVKALAEGNAEMREAALDVIADHLVGVPEFEPLVLQTLSKERSAGVRRAGVRALEGFKSDATLDTLLESLTMENCRAQAAHSLGKSPHKGTVDRLLALLVEGPGKKKAKKDDETREHERWVLKALAPHKDARIAAKAVEMLDARGAPAAECVLTSGDAKQLAEVAERLYGKEVELFDPAVRAATKLGAEEAFKRLSRIFEADDVNHESGKRRVASVVRGLGPGADPRWLKVLLKEMEEPGPQTVPAIGAIGAIGDKAAVKPLIKALAKPLTTPVKSAVITALGRLGDASAVGPIFDAVDKKQHDVAGAVRYAILALNDASALPRARELVASLEGNAWHHWYYKSLLEELEKKFGR
jgi:HEAT repeat protein